MKKIFILLSTVITLIFSTVYSEAKSINSSNTILVAGIQSARQTDESDVEPQTTSTQDNKEVEGENEIINPLILSGIITFLVLIFYAKFLISSYIRRKSMPDNYESNEISGTDHTDVYKESVNKNVFKISKSSDDDIREYEREREIK